MLYYSIPWRHKIASVERRQVIGLLVLVRIISWEERLLISTRWQLCQSNKMARPGLGAKGGADGAPDGKGSCQ